MESVVIEGGESPTLKAARTVIGLIRKRQAMVASILASDQRIRECAAASSKEDWGEMTVVTDHDGRSIGSYWDKRLCRVIDGKIRTICSHHKDSYSYGESYRIGFSGAHLMLLIPDVLTILESAILEEESLKGAAVSESNEDRSAEAES